MWHSGSQTSGTLLPQECSYNNDNQQYRYPDTQEKTSTTTHHELLSSQKEECQPNTHAQLHGDTTAAQFAQSLRQAQTTTGSTPPSLQSRQRHSPSQMSWLASAYKCLIP